ncbi:hypothetical protein Bhyg_12739 [Pseudolycoriella hygida]|uniref:Uncharacterized protein n=1 Tax=Pseudolycoriella hygida TaxID=35572 RepID=A0A9Q0S155_9DIPT|nr:hypothetical protein Bhyg_12739 [Pseudolycoriella hygida]
MFRVYYKEGRVFPFLLKYLSDFLRSELENEQTKEATTGNRRISEESIIAIQFRHGRKKPYANIEFKINDRKRPCALSSKYTNEKIIEFLAFSELELRQYFAYFNYFLFLVFFMHSNMNYLLIND